MLLGPNVVEEAGDWSSSLTLELGFIAETTVVTSFFVV